MKKSSKRSFLFWQVSQLIFLMVYYNGTLLDTTQLYTDLDL